MATFTFRTDAKTKEQLHQLATQLHRKPSGLLNALIKQLLDANTNRLSEPHQAAAPPSPSNATHKITARISDDEFHRLAAMAQAQCMKPATWVAMLIRGKLQTGQTLNREELAALRESTRQLQAIGRLLNQIARASPIDSREAGRQACDPLKHLAADIKAHTEKVGALLSVNSQRWRN